MFKMCLNTKYKPAAVVCSVCDWKWDRWNALAEVKCLYSTRSAHYFCFSDDVHCMKSIIVCHSDEDCFVRLPAFLAAGSRPVIAVNSFPRDVIIYSPSPSSSSLSLPAAAAALLLIHCWTERRGSSLTPTARGDRQTMILDVSDLQCFTSNNRRLWSETKTRSLLCTRRPSLCSKIDHWITVGCMNQWRN